MRDVDPVSMATGELAELARRQLEAWTRVALTLTPPDERRVDAHCHLGTDSDGSAIDEVQLLAQLDGAGMHAAAVTPLHHPGGYAAENPRVREAAAASGGRLFALHRCDPAVVDPAADARAGLEAGAVGLKWHPRAERFTMSDEVARATAAVAHEAGVPILIHAGRGMERLGEGVVELARACPRASFILAHAAISDLAWIVDATHDVPNVVFDTSWWRPTDLAVLLATCPPERVLHGTDPPYATAQLGVQLTIRMARACGWSDEAMSLLLGGNARRLFGTDGAADSHLEEHEPHMPTEVATFRRAGEFLAAAMQVSFADGDAEEVFDLACAALHVVDAHPRRDDARLLHACIDVGRELIRRDAAAPVGTPPATFMSWSEHRRLGVELLIATLCQLATPALPITGIDRVGWPDPAPFV